MRIPAAREGQRFVEVADRNGDVGFTLPDVGFPPQLPQREALRPAIGVEKGRFQAASSGGKERSLFRQVVCKGFVVSGRVSDQSSG